jgi:hypothetical protein
VIRTMFLVPEYDNQGSRFPLRLRGDLQRRLIAEFGGYTRQSGVIGEWRHEGRVLHDLEDRLGIQQGRFLPRKEDRPDRDPFDDKWLPVAEAARRKGVTAPGLHGAIRRGDVIAAPAKQGGSRLVVSRNSLDRWTPNPRRQAAGKQRARARATAATYEV